MVWYRIGQGGTILYRSRGPRFNLKNVERPEIHMKTAINGSWVVAWRNGQHQVLEGGTVIYEDNKIVFVGNPNDPACPKADKTIDARGKLVSPGLINLHCIANLDLQPIRMDMPNPPGYNRPPSIIDPDTPHILSDEDLRTSAEFSVVTLLKLGSTSFGAVTTGMTKGFEDPKEEPHALAEASLKYGARAWLGHMYHERCDYTDIGGSLVSKWDSRRGRQGLDHAVEFVKYLEGNGRGLVTGMLFPSQSAKCSDDLLKETMRQAQLLGGVHVRTHFSEYLPEYQEFKSEHPNQTMVEWLQSLGFVGPNVCLTHALYIAGHSSTGAGPGRDLEILRDTGTSICHCPWVFARSGVFMESFSRYVAAGVNVGIGNDSFPPDLIEEMRLGALTNKVVDCSRAAGTVREIYNAATIYGAKALGREDLGRLAPDCTADITVFDLSHLAAGPVDDPMRVLIHTASGRDTDMVIVDGKTVVEQGRVVGVDEEALWAKTQQTFLRYKANWVGLDWAKRSSDELYPPVIPIIRG